MYLNRNTLPGGALRHAGVFFLVSTLALVSTQVRADGIYRNGVGARSMSMGGADVAWADDALGAMGADPAALGFIKDTQANLGLFGGVLTGDFIKAPTSDGHLNSSFEALPEAALAIPLGKTPLTLGLSVIPDSILDAHWTYVDPPGGLGGKTSYGLQTQRSQIVDLRSAVGLGASIGEKLSVGASFGVAYNQNELQAPYIFQTAPKVKGAKVLLDLDTSGFGYNGQVGVMYRAMTNLQFGATYESPTRVYSQGDANGNAGPQFGVANLPFHYHAQVRNIFPQAVTGGGSWGFSPQWRLALQVDWVNWGSAFQTLPVSLSGGSNPAINAAAGSSSIQDNIPLDWRDEFVYRAGIEYKLTSQLALRAGYCFSPSAVPDQTLTPLTAAISEHTLCAGIGYQWKRCQIDLAYQYNIPITRNVGTSALLDGEYSNSSVEVAMHVVALTLGVTF
jgi:long-subunit fatty acid transport protein